MVVPDTRWGRDLSMREIRPEGMNVTLCDRFIPMRSYVHQDGDAMRPFDVPFCGRRDRMGSRWHNWCFRCVSGFPMTFIETERESETGYDTSLSL